MRLTRRIHTLAGEKYWHGVRGGAYCARPFRRTAQLARRASKIMTTEHARTRAEDTLENSKSGGRSGGAKRRGDNLGHVHEGRAIHGGSLSLFFEELVWLLSARKRTSQSTASICQRLPPRDKPKSKVKSRAGSRYRARSSRGQCCGVRVPYGELALPERMERK